MNKINIAAFRAEWEKIESLLDQLSSITKLGGDGNTFTGYLIDDIGVTYKSETYFSGCGTDYFDFQVKWDELNNPVEYFQNRFATEIKDDEERRARMKADQEIKEKERRKKEYEALKKEFE